MNKDYWEKFYANKRGCVEPSLFAKFVMNEYLREGTTLVEFGCGNGRDAVYFSEMGICTLAIDQCEKDILRLISNNNSHNLHFLCADFTALSDLGIFNNVYSRFTLHSISENQENDVLKWTYNSLSKGGYFFIEVRGQKNEIYRKGIPVPNERDAYIYEDHYRRFINNERFCSKLHDIGFQIVLNEEKKGFSPYNNDDQTFMRLICKKI